MSLQRWSDFERLFESRGCPRHGGGIACFFVVRRLRDLGIMRRILAAAVEHARSRGASIVEAYPVDPDSPSYRFMGFVPVLEGAGFREVRRVGNRSHVMRFEVRR